MAREAQEKYLRFTNRRASLAGRFACQETGADYQRTRVRDIWPLIPI